jgi:hypothetical protein
MRATLLRIGAIVAVVALAFAGSTYAFDDGGTATAATKQDGGQGGQHGHSGHRGTDDAAVVELGNGMRELWSDHMQWTYATVDAFFHNADALQPTLDRLLSNQVDLGAAIVPFYGQEAGDQLTELLTTHINLAVPVLQAAQAGDDPALQAALDDWYSNAQDVADFLAVANPDSWPQSVTRPALEMHIDQTTVYAVDLLTGEYAAAIEHYDAARHHMLELADVLADGIVEQFPEQLRS